MHEEVEVTGLGNQCGHKGSVHQGFESPSLDKWSMGLLGVATPLSREKNRSVQIRYRPQKVIHSLDNGITQ